MKNKDLKGWYEQTAKPLMIAGPCSAESEDQLRKSIFPILESIQYVRAGIWKPGHALVILKDQGFDGLQWLQN